MRVDWADLASKILPALLPAVATLVVTLRGPGVIRDRLKHDVEILEKVPENSKARRVMLYQVEEDVAKLRAYSIGERNTGVGILALLSAIGLWYAVLWLFQQDHWWTVLLAVAVGFLASACTYGVFESFKRVPRGGQGKRLSDE